jgi:hypothetical protein
MDKRFWISVVVMFVVSMGLGFVVHELLLGADYRALPGMFRPAPDAEQQFGYMIAAHVLIAVGFTWIYRQGREAGKSVLGQGLRFGAAVAVLSNVPGYMIYHAVQPLPLDLMIKQICFDVPAVLVMGVVVAAINQAPRPA